MFADTSGKALVVDIDPQCSAEEIIAASEAVSTAAVPVGARA